MKKISILGSTGSIGTQCLDIVSERPDDFDVVCITCGSNTEKLRRQIIDFRPKIAVCGREEDTVPLQKEFPDTEIMYGDEGLISAAEEDCDLVVNALSGIAGLAPTYRAICSGNDVALANKETLVAGGSIIMKTAGEKNVNIFPVDSEHCAIFQCLEGRKKDQVEKLILTGSGGPFRNYSYEAIERAGLEQALRHPNWEMGKKITIDSATMMNKGLEFIEAMWLFNQDPDHIQVVIHPQSIVHSMVQLIDGTVIAQLGPADMHIPIALALSWPERMENGFEKLDFTHALSLTFEKPDLEKFRCLKIAIEAARQGGSYPIVMNAANEVLVSLVLEEKIRFSMIPRYLENVMGHHGGCSFSTVDDILAIDREARQLTLETAGFSG